MTRRTGASLLLLAAIVALALAAYVLRRSPRPEVPRTSGPEVAASAAGGQALAVFGEIPMYQEMLRGAAVHRADRDREGTIHVDLDLPALLKPRLSDRGLDALCDGLPRSAQGEIRPDGSERWVLDGEAPMLAVLDPHPGDRTGSSAWSSIPGEPSAIAAARIIPARLAQPDFGGPALTDWRARVDIAEKVLGRPLRRELAEDLGGLAVFALYEPTPGREPSALVAVELNRSDRLRSLFDTMFALAALTERATIHRHRDVPVGFLRSPATGAGWAIAIDGDALLLARSSHLVEAAIDARRRRGSDTPLVARARALRASWGAISESAFVARGWARVARAVASGDVSGRTESVLTAEGPSSWRLTGTGPRPAITADPVVPFLRTVWRPAQRGAD